MKTPVCDFIEEYNRKASVRLHMPGHKGKASGGEEKGDITEIDGADVLYSAEGIIKQSRKNASLLFGTAETFYSTEGSSLCIRAMVYLAKAYSGKKAKILALRNAHKTFITACGIMDVDVSWLYGKTGQGITCCNVSCEEIEKAISEEKPTALYVTSPDYLGNMADIKDISRICKENGVLLMVDNAHGAYLNFLEENLHPIALGADICCDSAHKTLPVLTGGAYLHISESAPSFFKEKGEYALSLFASTSPSYLIIASLDRVNSYLSSDYRQELSESAERVAGLKAGLGERGYRFEGSEPMKLTLKAKDYGYRGEEISSYLAENNIVCEFSDADYVVMMFSTDTSEEDYEKLFGALCALEKKEPIKIVPPEFTASERVISVNEALYSPLKKVRIEESLGKVLGSISVSCPPAVPIAIAGERIGKKELELFKYYGIEECEIID